MSLHLLSRLAPSSCRRLPSQKSHTAIGRSIRRTGPMTDGKTRLMQSLRLVLILILHHTSPLFFLVGSPITSFVHAVSCQNTNGRERCLRVVSDVLRVCDCSVFFLSLLIPFLFPLFLAFFVKVCCVTPTIHHIRQRFLL